MPLNHQDELPKIVEKSESEIALAISLVENSDLPDDVKSFCIASIQLNAWIPKALLQNKITIALLKKLIFGSSSRKKKIKNDEALQSESEKIDQEKTRSEMLHSSSGSKARKKKPGHGRMPHHVYSDVTLHQLKIDDLSAGDCCPGNCGGKLYSISPGVLIRIKGQNVASVHQYHVDKLRCTLCSQMVSANIPEHVGKEKYDDSFKAIVALQKYYVAVPFYRQAYFQNILNVPLPASTQWDLVQHVGGCALPVFSVLEKMAANGTVIHHDDTRLKILNVVRAQEERTGTFTTGFISRMAGRDIALFYNGTKHAGENMEKLLEKRNSSLPKAIQMCDALNRNIPQAFETILCHCLSHGFRKFDDLKEFYPTHCLSIIKLLSKVYKHDEKTREMTPLARLHHHQKHSQPIMDQLHDLLTSLLSSKQVEPNEALGQAIRYMIKHWDPLTQFLRTEGAPLDNNIVERALKIPIRGRRTWLFYKTEYGAMIGAVLTSVIYTCALSRINPFKYLTALQKYKQQVISRPELWLPWNYEENAAFLSHAA